MLSDDRQLRDLTFWSLGSLGGASWTKVAAVAPLVLPVVARDAAPGRGLNALALGEAEAFHLGVPVQRVKALAILLVALAVGAAVAAAGDDRLRRHRRAACAEARGRRRTIACCCRRARSSAPRSLIAADSVARTIVAPAELPIGILTAAIGAPFFLWLLLRRERSAALA